MIIRAFGDSGRQRECERRLSLIKDGRYGKIIVLPIPTSRDGVTVNGTGMSFSEVAREASEGTLVAGYNIPDTLGDMLAERGAHIYDAGLDEAFLVENAEVTARGALGRILCELPRDISEQKIALVGYGRIGQRLTRLLLFLGASVTVYTRREETRLELSMSGVSAELLREECELSGFDMIINTAPARIMSEESARRLALDTRIFDLASGNNFPASEGIIKLGSVPDTMYPITAGRIYARYIAQYI